MRNRNNIKILIFILVAIIAVTIGYASISAINLVISGNSTANINQNNYNVRFLNEAGITPTIEGSPTNTVTITNDTTASFSVNTLEKKGDSVTAILKVKNFSNGVGTSISLEIINTNPTYYKATETIADSKLQAGEETTITIRIDMINTPFEEDVAADITTNLIASPIDEDTAIEINSITEDINKYYLYTTRVDDSSMDEEIESIPGIFKNPEEAIRDLTTGGEIVYKKLLMNGNTIEKKYIVQKVIDTAQIQYDVDEQNEENPKVFKRNVKELQNAYGESNCTLSEDNITCEKNTFFAEVNIDGSVRLQENITCCENTICARNCPD